MAKRVCFITLGQSPRAELISEIMRQARSSLDYNEAGALDGLTIEQINRMRPREGEKALVTQVADGSQVVISAKAMEARLRETVGRLDRLGYDLLVLVSSGIFHTFETSTPLLHGQLAVDDWIASFVLGTAQLGVVFPLRGQASDPASLFSYGILIQNSRQVAYSGEASRVDETALLLQNADLILMHSVGYSEEMAHRLAALSHKPVVTARRVIAGALHLRLTETAAGRDLELIQGTEVDMIKRLPPPNEPLTGREQQVLALVLEGQSNKAIAKRLGISHRTVEIHRGRAMVKYNASTAMQLIRRAMIENPR